MYAKIFFVLACTAMACGTVESSPDTSRDGQTMSGTGGIDAGSSERSMVDGPWTSTDTAPVTGQGGNAGTGSGGVGNGGTGGENAPPLKPCTHESLPLSYSVPCSDTCAVSCRDQVAHQVVGCVTSTGIACVESCEVCP